MNDIKNTLNKGQAMMVAVMFFMAVSITILFGLAGPVLRQQAMVSNLTKSRQSYFLAEAGIEDVIFRLKTAKQVSSTETLTLNGDTTTITSVDILDGKEITSIGDVNEKIRKLRTNVVLGSGVSFHFGIQAGNGGLRMENYSTVLGNIYSNGTIIGESPTHNIITGSAISAGPSGLVDNIRATSSAFAHTITNSTVDNNAYYQSISNTTVSGTSYPGSTDQATSTMPIPDSQIADWEAVAEAGGVITSPCPFKITAATTTGPKKIACDLEISGNNYTITLMGNLWVEGNVSIKNSPTIKIDSSFGNKGVAIIADKPSNHTTGSTITIENSAIFEGSGTTGSHVMLVSMNNSAEQGGNNVAIGVRNTVSGDLLVYAGHGEIRLENNINLKEVAAYLIRLQNTAEVVYETGITNLLFESGPSGGYEILDWEEIE